MLAVAIWGAAATTSPSVATRVLLVRHGQTEWNVEGRFQGHQDSPLTAAGVEQARVTGARLRAFPLAAIYSSDLPRAEKTAQLLSDGMALGVTVDNRLRERNFGIFEGKSVDEMRAAHPIEFDMMRNGGADYAIPGGESKLQVLHRLHSFIDELPERHAGKTVLLVSHGATLNIIMKAMLHLPPEAPTNWEMLNLNLSTLMHYRNERPHASGWKVRTIGDVSHLEAAGLI